MGGFATDNADLRPQVDPLLETFGFRKDVEQRRSPEGEEKGKYRPIADTLLEEAGMPTHGELISQLSGISGADAVRLAAQMQERVGREALTETEQAQLRLEETLAPFVQFGLGAIPGSEALFQDNVAQSLAASQPIVDLTEFGRQAVMNNPMLASVPGVSDALQQEALISGIEQLSRERGDLLSAIQLGQASAAQQAAGNLQTGASRADLLSQIGNVQAAGGIGAAQALGQGAQNVAGIGTALAQMFRRS